jgi:hypothetical protein
LTNLGNAEKRRREKKKKQKQGAFIYEKKPHKDNIVFHRFGRMHAIALTTKTATAATTTKITN